MWRYTSALLIAAGVLFAAFVACQQRSEFDYASPQYVLTFPKDHAAHPTYRTEWWYYTGHLNAAGGAQFGYQLTFFRSALSLTDPSSSASNARKQVYFAHFAITDETGSRFYHKEKQSRGAFGEAGAHEEYYKVFIGNWSVQDLGKYTLLQAESDTIALTLILEPTKPPVLHGEKGYSQKGESPKNASMYYSYTRLKSTGALTVQGKRYLVEGESWHDHEFGTSQLDPQSVGWDWFSMQLSDGTELMLFGVRQADGSLNRFSSGTFIDQNGQSLHLSKDEFSFEVLETYTSQKSGATYPSRWRVRVPKLAFEATLVPTVQDQEQLTEESTRITYWEGSVRITGTRDAQPITGKGYVELTGYAKPIRF